MEDKKDPDKKAVELEALKKAFADAQTADSDMSEMMNYIDSSDRARAYVVAQMLTEDIGKIKHITELSPQMISNLVVVGSTMAYMADKGINSSIRKNLYSEVLTLMISNTRKGRGEIAEILKSGFSQETLASKLQNKFGFVK